MNDMDASGRQRTPADATASREARRAAAHHLAAAARHVGEAAYGGGGVWRWRDEEVAEGEGR